MTTTYDPALCERLCREAREDDERMTSGPWRYDHQGWIESMDRTINHIGSETEVLTLGARNESDDGEGIARTRNNLRAMADQLEAARAEVERLTSLSDLRGQTVADLAHELGTVKGERAQLRDDVKRLAARLALESAALEQACTVDINSPITVAESLDRAIDAYRAALDRAGE